jgi:hypothetical protein
MCIRKRSVAPVAGYPLTFAENEDVMATETCFHVSTFFDCSVFSSSWFCDGLSRCYICDIFVFHKTKGNLRWVHTCNVTAYRNALTLQVTHTIRSYDLNFHPVPLGVRVSCERYTMGFPVCYRSKKHHECKGGERSGRW